MNNGIKAIQPLIMCGGAGTRLWPASRETLPKQFSPMLGKFSSFQETVLRVAAPGFATQPIVVASDAHRHLVERQLADINVKAELLLEPLRRDSGPAIAAGCLSIARRSPDALVLVLAADHLISDTAAFRQTVASAAPAAHAGRLVTFGIAPSYPATEYGYIQPGDSVEGEAFAVTRFAEKPDALTAAHYILAGYFWNSGNFLFTPRSLIEEYGRLDLHTLDATRRAVDNAVRRDDTLLLDRMAFGEARKQSIDYAVMEKTSRAAVARLSCGWSDLGTWDVIWSLGDRDNCGNVRRGAVELFDSRDCYVSTDGALTSLLGVSNLVVVANKDAILVADRKRSSEVKCVVESLREKGRLEAESHSQVFRPWGAYHVLERGEQYQVKRIIVNPAGRLSLQKHRFRAEHWVVVHGRARVTVGSTVTELGPNEHVEIPKGEIHRLENPSSVPVELIEVQTGTYLGEDDIVRLEDLYGRT